MSVPRQDWGRSLGAEGAVIKSEEVHLVQASSSRRGESMVLDSIFTSCTGQSSVDGV